MNRLDLRVPARRYYGCSGNIKVGDKTVRFTKSDFEDLFATLAKYNQNTNKLKVNSNKLPLELKEVKSLLDQMTGGSVTVNGPDHLVIYENGDIYQGTASVKLKGNVDGVNLNMNFKFKLTIAGKNLYLKCDVSGSGSGHGKALPIKGHLKIKARKI